MLVSILSRPEGRELRYWHALRRAVVRQVSILSRPEGRELLAQ